MKTLLLSLLMSSMAWGQVSQVGISNFNFKYEAPQGSGTADAFSYQQKRDAGQNVHVEKVGEDFKILLEGVENRELTLKNAPDIIKNANTIKLSAFDFSFNDKLLLTLNTAVFHSPDKTMDLKNLNLGCDRMATFPEVMDQVISGCIQKMSLRMGGLSASGESGLDQALMKAIDQGHDEILSAVGLKNVSLKVNGGKFDLSADIQAQISGTAKSTGSIKYEAAIKKITVKVTEVKFGFLDVTSKVFDELKKQESASLTVSKPYLYLTIK